MRTPDDRLYEARRKKAHLAKARARDMSILASGKVPLRMRFRINEKGEALTASGVPAPQVTALLQRLAAESEKRDPAFRTRVRLREFQDRADGLQASGGVHVLFGGGKSLEMRKNVITKPLPSEDPANDGERRLHDAIEEGRRSVHRSAAAADLTRAGVHVQREGDRIVAHRIVPDLPKAIAREAIATMRKLDPASLVVAKGSFKGQHARLGMTRSQMARARKRGEKSKR
jgi:hypothetical protein